MERIMVLVASSPSTPAAQRAFQLVRDLAAQGHQMTLALLEDGVLGSTGYLQEVALKEGAAVKVLGDDLALRGIGAGDLHPSCQTCTYAGLVDEMMAKSDRVLGAF